MLHNYRFKNFFSFQEECEVSLTVSLHVPDSELLAVSETGQRVSKILAVMGPNGSGKTNVIKPLAFLHDFISKSFHLRPDAHISCQPHFYAQSPESEFEIEFDSEGEMWRYELVVTAQRVIREALYRKTSRMFSYVFIREWDSSKEAYEVKQQGFGFNPKEAAKVRLNASLISTAAQYGVPLAEQIASLSFSTNVDYLGRMARSSDRVFVATELYKQNPLLNNRMVQLLIGWDLGLSSIEIRRIAVPNLQGEREEIDFPFGIHEAGSQKAELPLFQESSGTQGAFVLLSRLLPVLEYGGLAVIDELEADLHPHMLAPILDLFFNPRTNPKNAQIIFTCHAPEILNTLHKSQVLLVEKDDHHVSDAWRLDEVKGVRADDNLYAKYMAGAYDAVPQI